MSTLTTYRPMHVSARWILAVLVVVLAIITIEMGLANAHRFSAEPVGVPAQSTPSHATMSGDLLSQVAA